MNSISAEDFIKWVEYAESSVSVSFAEVKQQWTQKKGKNSHSYPF